MHIAIISFISLGVNKRVAPFESLYFCVFLFSFMNFAAPEFVLVSEILISLEFSGNTIDTALFSIPRYLLATLFTSSAVTFFMFSR